MNKPRLALLPLLVASLALAACSPSADTARTTTAPSAPAEAATGRAIDITANDTMKFSLTEIRAKPGETLTVTLRNIGTMPKFSMGHNWVLLKADTDLIAFTNAAATAAATDYLPAAYKSSILAATRLLGPKEQDTITFTAPKQPGSYPFLCSFPGHMQVGMKGSLIVE